MEKGHCINPLMNEWMNEFKLQLSVANLINYIQMIGYITLYS